METAIAILCPEPEPEDRINIVANQVGVNPVA